MREAILLSFFFLCFTTVLGIWGLQNDNIRITGEDFALPSRDQYYFVVSITINDEHVCGGFIYSQTFIVTTASCVYGKSTTEVHAIVGEISLINEDPGEQRMQIRAILTHEQYNATTRLNDIALLETSKAIVFSDSVRPGYFNAIEPDESQYISVYGWGATDPDESLSTALRYGILPLRNECREFPLEEEYFPNFMFCAGEDPKSTNETYEFSYLCQHDEGSPGIQVQGSKGSYIVGLASKHITCGRDQISNSTIFTRLSAYYSWLYRNAGAQPPMPPTTTSTTTTTLPTTYLPITPLPNETDYVR